MFLLPFLLLGNVDNLFYIPLVGLFLVAVMQSGAKKKKKKPLQDDLSSCLEARGSFI